MQRRALFLVLAALVGIGAFVWSQAGDPVAPPGPGPNGVAPNAVTPDAPTPGGQQPVPPPVQVPAGAPHVRVEVVTRERFVPPPLATADAVDAEGHALPLELLAGAGAGFDAAPGAAGLALARVAVAGRALLRQVAIGFDAPARVVVGAPLAVTGTVRDEQQRPLAGASVWFGEIAADGVWREFVTDEEGVYHGDAAAGDGVPWLVRAKGCASTWRVVTVAAPMPALDVALQPAVALEVQLASAAFDAGSARAFVAPLEPVATGLSQYPFFVETLADGFAFDAAGRAVVEDLPRDCVLGVVARHPRIPGAAPQRVVVKGERQRVLVQARPVAATLQGRVVDERGAPLAGVAVWARGNGGALAGNAPRFLPPHLDLHGAFAATTDADGRFVVGVGDATKAVLSLRARGRAGRDLPAGAAPDADLVLPDWSTGAAEFVLSPPVPGVAWTAATTLGGGIETQLAADATWRVAFPHAGRFDLVVTTRVGGREANRRYDDAFVTGSLPLAAPAPKGP